MKGILLISGGFDSAVAGYLLKNKLDLIGLHFSYEPFTDKNPEIKSKDVCDILKIKKFMSINIGKDIENISNRCGQRYYFILSKRLMFKKAEEIARQEGAEFIITGESLAQVSSQTLENLYCIDQAVKIPVLRPLIGFNKDEIIDIAKKIGTYEVCIGPEVCDVLGPKHPLTKANIIRVEEEEKLYGNLS